MVKLTEERKALLEPLYSKATDFEDEPSILKDKKASEICQDIEYDFDKLKMRTGMRTTLNLRAKLMDDYVRQFLSYNDDVTVLNLGCGLDGRNFRVNKKALRWYDIDLPEVITLRQLFYEESFTKRMFGTTMEAGWVEGLKIPSRTCLILAEGFFAQREEEAIEALLLELKETLGTYTILFDAHRKAQRKKGIQWGLKKEEDLATRVEGLIYRHSMYMTKNPYVEGLPFWTRAFYSMKNRFKPARDAHRILVYEMTEEAGGQEEREFFHEDNHHKRG